MPCSMFHACLGFVAFHPSFSTLPVSVNANLDLIVSATPLLEALGLSPGQPVDHTHLVSAGDLQEQVSYSMLHCAGTERVFTSHAEFQRIVKAAHKLQHTVRTLCMHIPVPKVYLTSPGPSEIGHNLSISQNDATKPQVLPGLR